MAKRYLSWLYIKHFVIILVILELFFLLIDFLQNQKEMPDAMNLVVLYLYFQSIGALKITLPLSLVFGALSLFIHLIRTNEIIALLSFGFSKQKIIQPIVIIAFAIASIFIFVNSTKIGYFYENGQALLKNRDHSAATENLFFKFNDNYIYIQKLNPLTQEATNIKLFHIKNGLVDAVTYSSAAKYTGDSWHLSKAKIIIIPTGMKISNDALVVSERESVVTLDGFKPKVMDGILNTNAALNISDMIDALFVLNNQDMDIERIRQLLFSTILTPLLAPIAIVIMFAYTPISARFFDVTTFSSISIFSILAGFGVINALSRAKFSNINLSFVLILIAVVLSGISYNIYRKRLH